ncbi:MAG: prenyltransferase [Pseudomonadota bacterium]
MNERSGVDDPRYDAAFREAMLRPGIRGVFLKWATILRLPFLSASLVSVLIGAAWAGFRHPTAPVPWWAFPLAFLGAAAIHTAANTFNDYFDWRSGTDRVNIDYLAPFTGGSRAVDLGLISERGLFAVASVALLIAVGVGGCFLAAGRTAILVIGLVGAFSAYFYTAPPLRLVARKGVGEFLIGLNFGVLVAAGTAYVLSGSLSAADFWIGVPIGLLTVAILWINQFPDAASDEATGKNHLVVVLGKRKARWGYVALLGAAFVVQAGMVAYGLLSAGGLLPLITLPLALYAARVMFLSYRDRSLARGCAATIKLQLLFGILSAAGLHWF